MITPNNIYLGDAYELIKELPTNSVDLIITDPPYDFKSMVGGGFMKKEENQKFAKQIMETNLDKGIKKEIFDEWVRVLKKVNIYIWCNKEQIIPYIDYFVKEKGCNWEVLIWHKTNPTAFCGTHYLIDKEYCLYFWETGAKIHIPFERGKTIFQSTKNVTDKNNYNHPTIKPLTFIEDLIRNSSEEGDVVLDTFLGSGTTALGCKHTNRKYIGFEIDPNYFKIAKDRLEGFNQKGIGNLFDMEM